MQKKTRFVGMHDIMGFNRRKPASMIPATMPPTAHSPSGKRGTVLITGTDSGLGLAFVHTFLAENWIVFAGWIQTDSPVTHMDNPHLIPVFLDITDLESIKAARSEIMAHTPSLDLLINNAGINPDCGIPLEKLDFDVVQQVLNVNAVGPLRVTQQCVGLLRKGAYKRIVNLSSEAGSIIDCRRKSWFGYSMSKAALNIQTRLLQNYLGAEGFRVYSAHPGGMRTGMGSAVAGLSPQESANRLYAPITGFADNDIPQFFELDGKPMRW
ncbi:MAG: SDR family NAD(P)-dependent oxidoreductase [Chitinivibrionales bacterium]|nr:SDR family NAD(P)-dependent oxidoreductase [Chitinivibrionales bacterium]